MLQKGHAFSAHMEQVMWSCQQPDFRSISLPSMMVPSAHTLDVIAHAVSQSVVPTVVEHNHQALIRAHASVVNNTYILHHASPLVNMFNKHAH
jgi:hypothetical protein